MFFLASYVASEALELHSIYLFPASLFMIFLHVFTFIFWLTQYCLSTILLLCKGESDTAPTNKISRRGSSEQGPRTRTSHEQELLF